MSWSILLFSLAVSLDGFGVGLSYGMQKIRITAVSFMIICLSSAAAVTASMLAGSLVASLLPLKVTNTIGAVMLIIVGGWIVLQNLILNMMPDYHVFRFKMANMGIVINILKEPVQADADRSGVIDIKEALFLGTALAIDALGAGFGAAMSGFHPFWTPLAVALMKFLLVSLGLFWGEKLPVNKVQGEITLLPGGIIVFLGLAKLISL